MWLKVKIESSPWVPRSGGAALSKKGIQEADFIVVQELPDRGHLVAIYFLDYNIRN
jgi:hypothetical protein